MKIAITGATGQVGGKIVDRLIDTDHALVLLSRSEAAAPHAVAKGATVVAGDIGDVGFLTAALRGVDAFYVMMPPDNGARDVLGHYRRVIDAGVAAIAANQPIRVVLQSSYGAQHPQGTGPIVGCHTAEQAFAAVAEDLHVLRNGYFMENFKWMARPMNAGAVIPLPVEGGSRTSFVATRDIAEAAAEALADDGWTGHHLREVLGPEDLSFDEVADLISDAAGREIKHFEMSDDMSVAALTTPEVGFSPEYARLFVELHRAIDSGHLTHEFPRVARTSTPTRFADFARDDIAPQLDNGA